MTLLEAFRRLAPLIGESATDHQRTEAARVVHAALQGLARSTPLLRSSPQADRDEAVGIVLLRLVQAGPRSVRVGDPEDDGSVLRYLRAALHNAARDRARAVSRHLEVPLDDTDRLPESSRSADELIDLSRAAGELQAAFESIWSELVPIATGGKRGAAGERLRSSVGELVELFEGRTSVERLVATAVPEGTPEALRKARYALYQRHHRALVSLFDALDVLESSSGLPPIRLQTMRAVLNGLRVGTEPRANKENS